MSMSTSQMRAIARRMRALALGVAVAFVIGGCGGGGGDGRTGGPDGSQDPSVVTEPQATYTSGSMVKAALPDGETVDTASARLGAAELPIVELDGSAFLMLPGIVGDFDLEVTSSAGTQTTRVRLVAPDLPAAPGAYLSNALSEQMERLRQIRAENPASPFDDSMAEAQEKLQEAQTRLGQLSEAELREVAYVYAAMALGPKPDARSQLLSLSVTAKNTCMQDATGFLNAAAMTFASGGLLAGILGTPAAATLGGGVLIGTVSATYLVGIYDIVDYIEKFRDDCYDPEGLVQAADEQSGQEDNVQFTSGVARKWTVSQMEKLESDVGTTVSSSASRLKGVLSHIVGFAERISRLLSLKKPPAIVLTSRQVLDDLAELEAARTSPARAADYEIGMVSDSRITVSLLDAGPGKFGIVARLNGASGPVEIPYSFTIVRKETKEIVATKVGLLVYTGLCRKLPLVADGKYQLLWKPVPGSGITYSQYELYEGIVETTGKANEWSGGTARWTETVTVDGATTRVPRSGVIEWIWDCKKDKLVWNFVQLLYDRVTETFTEDPANLKYRGQVEAVFGPR